MKKATAKKSSKGPIQIFDREELATVLAALRMFQEEFEGRDASHIRAFSIGGHFEPDIEPLGTDDIDALCERLNLAPEVATKPEVVIEVSDGVATVSDCPENIEVCIVDWDMFDQGDNSLTGENAVTENFRAWLEKNRPEWYAEQLRREGKDAEWGHGGQHNGMDRTF